MEIKALDANSNIKELQYEKIPKLLFRYFLPAFAGVIVNSLYNIVDRIFIGQYVGDLALSGLTAVFPIMVIFMAFGMLVGIGASVRVSINLGKKDINRAERVLGNAFVLLIIISITVGVIAYFLKLPLLKLFNVTAATEGYALQYLNIILGGLIFNIVGYGINNIIRSEGSSVIAMISMIISAFVNVLFDYIFIVKMDMGVQGAAYATVLAQFILCIWVILHFKSKRSVIKLRTKMMKLNKEIIIYIITIGFAPFLMQIASSLVFGVFNYQLTKYGNDVALGALGVIMSVSMLLVMSIMSINMAMQPIVSFNYGAKNYKRVKETLSIALIAATIMSVFSWLVAEIFPSQIISLFNTDSIELHTLGTQGLRVFMLVMPIVGFQIVIGNYFQAVGRAGLATFISLLRQVIFLLPLLFILPQFMGLDGVWASSPASDSLSAVVSAFFVIAEYKRLNKLIGSNV